ncbi:diguanylate cyclase [Desulforhopalus vacuolatus]|uniref:sensor domain-containing diguanylate cyclase n=1 Tax=Desulforhopalus vacuolatus TaxID=40414 RepID=UPI001966A9C5|nr:diguanylate cyclase [Desulforhopalus vacuolatus]MBM9520907.1 diguanylate cyclase [Desulforhopalus vacuolatus]
MKNNKVLIFLSLLLFSTYSVFIWQIYNTVKNDLLKNVHSWAADRQTIFNIVLREKATAMQQIATYVGNTPEIQKLFLEAKTALERNNNDHNAPQVNDIRRTLYDTVRHSWEVMHTRYDVRQLHFHFAPGSTSFLRVHSPLKFSDNMDDVRYTILDANTLLIPTMGVETGRVYTGIRGVIPMFALDEVSDKKIHTGALEAGTSFSLLLKMLQNEMSTNFAILLSSGHVQKNMWDECVAKKFDKDNRLESFFIEDTTQSPALTKRIFDLAKQKKIIEEKQGYGIAELDGQYYKIAHFSLRDYRGTLHADLPDAGMVLCWENITPLWNHFHTRTRNTILIAILSLILLEIALLTGWHITSNQLKHIIRKQTARMEFLATRDPLTGILNRRKIEEHVAREINRHHRYNTEFSMIMFDLDHFKKVNDTWGHDVGDIVLKKVVARTSATLREIDIFARWGGEEFLILLPETSIDMAYQAAERIRLAIRETKIYEELTITVSLGVAQYVDGETMDEIIKNADLAMYEAKHKGRDCTCVKSSDSPDPLV